MSVLLISAQAVKDRSRIVEAVDADVLRPTIDTAQRVHLLPILGAGLYDYLIANYSSLDSDHTTLLQTYIWPALVHFVVLEAVDDLTYRIEGGSVGMRQSDNLTNASESEINRLRDRERQRAHSEAVRLIKHIRDNTSTFTTYGKKGAVSGNIYPASELDFQGNTLEYAVRSRKPLRRYLYDDPRS